MSRRYNQEEKEYMIKMAIEIVEKCFYMQMKQIM